MSAELDDIIATLERGDWGTWKKIVALDGSAFVVQCCCNSEKCQRIRTVQTSGRRAVVMEEMDGPDPKQMPIEIKKILDVCRTNATLQNQVIAYNRSRFDLVFTCAGRAVLDWTIGDS